MHWPLSSVSTHPGFTSWASAALPVHADTCFGSHRNNLLRATALPVRGCRKPRDLSSYKHSLLSSLTQICCFWFAAGGEGFIKIQKYPSSINIKRQKGEGLTYYKNFPWTSGSLTNAHKQPFILKKRVYYWNSLFCFCCFKKMMKRKIMVGEFSHPATHKKA